MAFDRGPHLDTAFQHMSESVYVGLSRKIGTEQEIALRRETMNISEFILNRVNKSYVSCTVLMENGSQREGFRLKDSDIDYMYWPNNHRVIWDFVQVQFYDTASYAMILSDSSDSPPGYTLLSLPMEEANNNVLSACVTINEANYISSAKYREIMCGVVSENSTIKGPCSSGYVRSLEYDDAHGFVSDFWPPIASSWRERSHSWPPPQVVNDIVRSGCHFVAIGHKLGTHVDNEWRISFSQAEHKLTQSMNHTQFLTYGLLKLFLKEIINKGLCEEDRILSSYHMKTVVFWSIQQNTIASWCPQNLLSGFWICFKLLLKWVYEGVCPNFFIPENNMFSNKVYGGDQKKLFLQMHRMYEKGIGFLLQNLSISSYIMNVLCSLSLSVCTDGGTLISETEFDVELMNELDRNDIAIARNLSYNKCVLETVEHFLDSTLTQFQILMLQRITGTMFRNTAFILSNVIFYRDTNKLVYTADKMACRLLKLAAKFGLVSDMLYIAMYYYESFRFREALLVIEMTKFKLAQPCMLYIRPLDPDKYVETVGGLSWSTKMKQAVAQDIRLRNKICYINELTLEQQSGLQHRRNEIYIPPVILLHMLEFLCYMHIEPVIAQTPLDDLTEIVHNDQGVFISEELRDISWEILGICQQISGDDHSALYSYQQSLSQYSYNKIETATLQRIGDLDLRTEILEHLI